MAFDQENFRTRVQGSISFTELHCRWNKGNAPMEILDLYQGQEQAALVIVLVASFKDLYSEFASRIMLVVSMKDLHFDFASRSSLDVVHWTHLYSHKGLFSVALLSREL